MMTTRLHAMPPAPRGHPIAPPGDRQRHLEAANDEHANLPPPGPPNRPANPRKRLAAIGTALTAAVALAGAAILLLASTAGF
jgi:hypothetical protein